MKKVIILLLTVFAVAASLPAQDFEALAERIDLQRYEFPQEKIHVMTDRGNYMAGDTVWLRAWVVDASTHCQVDASKFVYIELVAPDDSVCSRVKIHQKDDGSFSGYLPLDIDLPEGRYQLSAYTMFMQSTGTEYFYHQPIDIVALTSLKYRITSKRVRHDDEIDVTLRYEYADGSPCPYNVFAYEHFDMSYNKYQYNGSLKEYHLTLKGEDARMQSLLVSFDNYFKFIPLPRQEGIDLTFYPEGGYLVPGVENAVTFKLVNTGTTALATNGELVDDGGNVIALLVVEHDGMGMVSFVPVAGTTYSARWKNDMDEYVTVALPQVNPDATVLQVRRDGNGLIQVKAAGAQAQRSLIMIQERGQLVTAGYSSVTINEQDLSPGVVQALLLDDDMRCLSERLFFANGDATMNTAVVTTDQASYGNREQVKVSVDLAQVTNNMGDYAVSVLDLNATEASEGNILANLLLQSDLRGRINHPAYYFEANDSVSTEQRNRHLDLLMLTQGWRRYDISRALRGRLAEPQHPIEVSQVVTGRVLSEWRKKPVTGATVSLIAPRVEYSATTSTDSLGEFIISLPLLPDSVDCIVMAENAKGKLQMNLELDEEIFPLNYYLTGPEYEHKAKTITDEQMWRLEHTGDWRHVILNEVLVTAVRPRIAASERNPYILSPRKIANKGINSIDAVVREFPGLTISGGNIYTTGGRDIDRVSIIVDGERVIEEITGAPDGIDKNADMINQIISDRQSEHHSTHLFLPTSITPAGFEANEINMAQTLVNFDELSAVRFVRYGGHGGALFFYHKEGHVRGSGGSKKPRLYLKVISPLGAQKPAEYYTPHYDDGDQGMEPGTDLRTLLYWNPSVTVNGNAKSQFDFYASDAPNTTYLITIEGISQDGTPIRSIHQVTKR